ncbi:MAG: class I SAM-dependent methyltransferase [Bacteroidota bacterium]
MKDNPFDAHTREYENWFIENNILFQSELLALKQVVPINKKGIEIGIGSGIFAEQLGIQFGIDPSENMLKYARKRNLDVQKGVAEELPYDNESFDYAVFITSICFVDDTQQAIKEAKRILKKHGEIIIAIIDRATPYGKLLNEGKEQNKFYKYARFFSTDEILELLKANSFSITQIKQTLKNLTTTIVETPEEGYGKGCFVVIKAIKNKQ